MLAHDSLLDQNVRDELEFFIQPHYTEYHLLETILVTDRWLLGEQTPREAHDEIVTEIRPYLSTCEITTMWLYLDDKGGWDHAFTTGETEEYSLLERRSSWSEGMSIAYGAGLKAAHEDEQCGSYDLTRALWHKFSACWLQGYGHRLSSERKNKMGDGHE